jgi:hypothetical protein
VLQDRHHTRRPTLSAGLGAIAFSVLTLVAVTVAGAPGGNYSASGVADYLAHGHRIAVLVVFHLAMLGLLGLIAVLAHLRDQLENRRAASVAWGIGLASTACFAVGWGVVAGQVIAHLEGGRSITIAPAVTYLISEIGVVFIFGCGAILLGLALIVLTLNARTLLPSWLRWLTLICGIAGVAGLAFITFFVLMLWGLTTGAWLIATSKRATTTSRAVAHAGA